MNAVDTRNKNWHVPISAAVGGGVGAFFCFPFEALKKKLQSDQSITRHSFHLPELYRGSSPFAISVTAATVASMTFRHVLQVMFGTDRSSTSREAATAIVGGMLGAVVGSTPVENVILAQQLNKTGPLKAVQILLKQGITRPWVGLPELAMREAGFAGVMLWGGRAAREKVYDWTQSQALSNIAEIGASLIGAAATQPFDTLATRKQKSDGALSSTQAIQGIYLKDGARGFFRGLSQRAFLFTGCALIIPRMENAVADVLNLLDK